MLLHGNTHHKLNLHPFRTPYVAAPPPPPPVHSPLADALETLDDDITDVPPGSTATHHLPHPIKPIRAVAPMATLTSTTNEKAPKIIPGEAPFFYVQRTTGFKKTKGWPAMLQRKQVSDVKEEGIEAIPKFAENELLEVGVMAQRVQQSTAIFVIGFIAGLTVWYAIIAQLLFTYLAEGEEPGSDNYSLFVLFYRQMSLPMGCIFFCLITFCLFSVIDRYDLSFFSSLELQEMFRLKNGALPLLILYTAALVVTLVCTQHDARLYTTPVSVIKMEEETTKAPQFSTLATSTLASVLSPQSQAQNVQSMFFNQAQQTSTLSLPVGQQPREVTTKLSPEVYLLSDLHESLILWIRLNFVRAGLCLIAWLVSVISNDEDRLAKYLQGLMETKENNAIPTNPTQPAVVITAPINETIEPAKKPSEAS